jgi:ketosteroid isomerase-like protein
MARISSAAYVTAVLNFLQAYNRGDYDACEQCFDPQVQWHSAISHSGRPEVMAMLKSFGERWTKVQVRPDDFREAHGHVLMIVCFHEGDPDSPPRQQRQSWIADINDDGLISRVISYTSPGEAARALETLAPKVHA